MIYSPTPLSLSLRWSSEVLDVEGSEAGSTRDEDEVEVWLLGITTLGWEWMELQYLKGLKSPWMVISWPSWGNLIH